MHSFALYQYLGQTELEDPWTSHLVTFFGKPHYERLRNLTDLSLRPAVAIPSLPGVWPVDSDASSSAQLSSNRDDRVVATPPQSHPVDVVEDGIVACLKPGFNSLTIQDIALAGPSQDKPVLPSIATAIGSSKTTSSKRKSATPSQTVSGQHADSLLKRPRRKQDGNKEALRWSCPFVKNDPTRYTLVYNKCTNRPGFEELKRVIEHLHRVHSTQLVCRNCRKRFSKTKDKDSHMAKTSCDYVAETPNDPEWMTTEQETIFNKGFDRDLTAVQRYRAIFGHLFPDNPNKGTVDPKYNFTCLNQEAFQSEPQSAIRPSRSSDSGSDSNFASSAGNVPTPPVISQPAKTNSLEPVVKDLTRYNNDLPQQPSAEVPPSLIVDSESSSLTGTVNPFNVLGPYQPTLPRKETQTTVDPYVADQSIFGDLDQHWDAGLMTQAALDDWFRQFEA